ncbi:MAG: OmpH family outer membrane protein [Acidobacteria bacterium]|nr:OmpH family outer membrane protein [Acidobacteriota bacterium]
MIPAVLAVMLGAAPVFAQAAGQQPAPKPAAPATQAPAQPAPAQQPPAAQPQPPRPFPEGAKIAYVQLPLIAQNSTEGKAASARIQELQSKKQVELQEKNKSLQAAQQKLTSGGTVLNDQARAQLEKDIERQQREIQFAQQNAQAEVQDLTADLQEQFRQKLVPILNQIGEERGLHFIFSAGDAGFIYANPGLDLTQEVIKRLDTRATAAPKQ